jgi:hypothetical protein
VAGRASATHEDRVCGGAGCCSPFSDQAQPDGARWGFAACVSRIKGTVAAREWSRGSQGRQSCVGEERPDQYLLNMHLPGVGIFLTLFTSGEYSGLDSSGHNDT